MCEVLGDSEKFIWEIQERHFNFSFSRWSAMEREGGWDRVAGGYLVWGWGVTLIPIQHVR